MTAPTVEAFAELLTGMIEARREYAAEHGMTVTDDEIADSVRRSLIRMMTAEATR